MEPLAEEPSSKKRRVENGKGAADPTSALATEKAPGSQALNEYSGYILQPGATLQTVDVKDLSPKSFYERFVGRREPCVIRGHIQDASWRGAQWTDEYLKEKAGEVKVRVEHRTDASGRFGLGQERWASFGEVVNELANGSCLYYLTTQELGHGLDGQPDVISPPVTALVGDIPLRPELAAGLVVQNVNLWLGRSEEPTTTGLHHDHHDNLYILLRGSKTFRLYSPADAAGMYLSGELACVHPNGRINYRGQPTRADGADPAAERALAADRRRAALEREVAAAAAAVAAGKPGAAEELSAAEERLEEALDEILAVECEREGGGGQNGGESGGESGSSDDEEGEGWGDALGGDVLPLPEDIAVAAANGACSGRAGGGGSGGASSGTADDSVAGSGSSGGGGGGGGGGGTSGGGGSSGGGGGSTSDGGGSSGGGGSGSSGGGGSSGADGGGTASNGGARNGAGGGSAIGTEADRGTNGHLQGQLPENFSKVDTGLPEAELKARFPAFCEAVGTTAALAAGDMLYLPCGWFHEVKSGGGLHMALNYWFHPPDAGAGGSADAPYSSDFWQQDWTDRIRCGALHCRAD